MFDQTTTMILLFWLATAVFLVALLALARFLAGHELETLRRRIAGEVGGTFEVALQRGLLPIPEFMRRGPAETSEPVDTPAAASLAELSRKIRELEEELKNTQSRL